MEFYTSSENYGYDSIQVTDREPRKFVKPKSLFSFRKTERFSTLSAEERWNYTKKINALQKLINEIQTSKEPITETPAFSLEEVLEVLKVRMAMHEK
jgi:hypothetical protein